MRAKLRQTPQQLEWVAVYKRILQSVLERRPSGTRQRLADALGKNRSFISQISNPIYPTPIPVQHLETIFAITHFSRSEKEEFLRAYRNAHPRRLTLLKPRVRFRKLSVNVPDLGDPQLNARIDECVREFVEKLGTVIRMSIARNKPGEEQRNEEADQ